MEDPALKDALEKLGPGSKLVKAATARRTPFKRKQSGELIQEVIDGKEEAKDIIKKRLDQLEEKIAADRAEANKDPEVLTPSLDDRVSKVSFSSWFSC